MLLLRTNGGLPVQSLTLTLESLKIAKLSSWVPLMGSEFFFGGDFGSFFATAPRAT